MKKAWGNGMVTYSELIPREAILQGVGDAKKVTIIGCPHCANTSLAYVNNIPLGKTRGGNLLSMMTSKPTALIQEANSIKELLENRGITTKVTILGKMMPPCGMNEKGHRKIAKIADGSDCVVALSCICGCVGIKSALPKTLKIFPAMNTLGWIDIFRKVEKGHYFIDKQKSKVIYAKGQQAPK
jgi:hypothetical protein